MLTIGWCFKVGRGKGEGVRVEMYGNYVLCCMDFVNGGC